MSEDLILQTSKKISKRSVCSIVYKSFLFFFICCILAILIFFIVAGVKASIQINDIKENVEDRMLDAFGSWDNLTLFIEKATYIVDEVCDLSPTCKEIYG